MLPVFRHVHDAAFKRLRGAIETCFQVADGYRALLGRLDPGYAFQEFGASTASEPGQAQNFPLVQGEADILISPHSGQVLYCKQYLAALCSGGVQPPGSILELEALPHDQGRERLFIQLAAIFAAQGPAIADHGHPVTDRQQFIGPVGDYDHCVSFFFSFSDDPVQQLLIILGEAGGSLVQHHYPGILHVTGLEHEQQLLLTHGQIPRLGPGIDLQVGPGDHLICSGVKLLPVDNHVPLPEVTEEEVLGHREIQDHLRLLRHHRDLLSLSGNPRQGSVFLIADQDLALGRFDDAGNDIHQR